jgi:GNAT superfamily N-acetyltransferase
MMCMTAEQTLADAAYQRDLGDGLRIRWSTAADTEEIASLIGFVFREKADDPPNEHMIARTRHQLRGDYPLMGPGDYVVVLDPSRTEQQVIACACLWHHTWEYAGLPFGVGRPEYVAVHPEYRRRGLIRAIFALLHARSAALGHRIQVITGIPHFYRQFGYEYALELGGVRMVPLSLIPAAKPEAEEPYQLRLATEADIPLMMELFARRRDEMLIWGTTTAEDWRYQIVEWADPTAPGKQSDYMMITDQAGAVVGFLEVAIKRWGAYLGVFQLETLAGVNLHAMLPPLLRALAARGQTAPNIHTDEPLRGLGIQLGRSHPIYDALGTNLAPGTDPPYAWYVRVADIPGFVRFIAPVLEQRLAASVLGSYTGEIKLDMYRGGLRLAFENGTLATVEPWEAPPFGDVASAGCPALIFTQLLFGYRTLDEVRYAFPDVWASDDAQILLNVLFPKCPSSIH